MNIDDTTLIDYLDKQLSDEERKMFEHRMEMDADLQQRVQAMKASVLPYQAAFNDEDLPEMPAHLNQKLSEITALLDDEKPVVERTGLSLAWVASFVILAFCSGVLVKHMIAPSPQVAISAHERLPIDEALLQAMIQYQALYTRDTVKHATQTSARTQAVLTQFFGENESSFSLPDLQQNGYGFRRAQLLAHQGQSILQLVYLPEQGEPLALCITRSNNELDVKNSKLVYPYAGINSLVWNKQTMTMMLMHNASVESLNALYNSIENT